MRYDAQRALEGSVPTVARDLSHAAAPKSTRTQGVGVRVTASNSRQTTPVERGISTLNETNAF
jgi:hypothetical protein